MSGYSQSTATSQTPKGTKRKWTSEEDTALVSCMVELRNIGTFNADTGFKAGYLIELQRMMENFLPNANLKAKPNLESRIRTLQKDWAIIHDMLRGSNTSGFGWDEHRQMLVVEDPVWDSYLAVHKEAAQFKIRTFPFYQQLSSVYAKDRGTGKTAQYGPDIDEELRAADAGHEGMNEEGGYENESDAGVSLDEIDVSATQSKSSNLDRGNSTFSNKKRKTSIENELVDPSISAATLLGENIRQVGLELSRSIASEMVIHEKAQMTIYEKAQELYAALSDIEGLTHDQLFVALTKIPAHPTQMLVFFSLPPSLRLEWVSRFISAS